MLEYEFAKYLTSCSACIIKKNPNILTILENKLTVLQIRSANKTLTQRIKRKSYYIRPLLSCNSIVMQIIVENDNIGSVSGKYYAVNDWKRVLGNL